MKKAMCKICTLLFTFNEISVIRNLLITATGLDAINAVGYRANSFRAAQFRI